MSYTDIRYYLHEVDYLTPRTATEQLHNSLTQRHQAARQVSQYDRPFLSPLPMPSPTSCWYPQQDVHIGYSYPDPACPIPTLTFSTPRPSLVSDPQPPDPPDWQCHSTDPVMPNLEPNLRLASLVSQLEHLTATVEQLASRMDANKRCPGDPHAAMGPTSHLRTAAPLAATTAVSSMNLPPLAPPCSPDISGDEGELLEDDPPPPAVIFQPGGPDTSPTLVPHVVHAAAPSLIQMEISEGVKRDCFSSSLGKSRVTDKFHNMDDIGFNDDANSIDGDVARMKHRPTLLDGDTRWIPPHKDTLCLNIQGRVDKLPVLTMNFGNPNGHPLMIFDEGDDGRCSTVRFPYDPGGDVPRQAYVIRLSSLLRVPTLRTRWI